jgi:hypothetical protein
MRAIARPLTLALVVAMVSCSGGSGGSTVPVVQDYTSSAAPVHAKPQSVIPPCGGICHMPGGGGGCPPSGGDSAKSGTQALDTPSGKTVTPDCAPVATPIPLATNTENPDDPDGPGHGPLPNQSFIVSDPDDACAQGYALAFSNGNSNPVGGAYCGVETIPNAAQVALSFDVAQVVYETIHYWNRHLACYVHLNYTSTNWNGNVIYPDFYPQTNNYPTTPGVSKAYTGANMVTDDNGVSTKFGYRVALVSSTPVFPGVTFLTYNVGTSYLVPRRDDCPKPYPNYP